MSDKKRILFVDDESYMLKSLERLLYDKRPVWEMVFVQSVEEAIDVLYESDYEEGKMTSWPLVFFFQLIIK